MIRTATAGAAGFGLLLALAGCSATLAASPYKGPDLGVFGVGSTSEEVERVLGRPISSSTNADGGRTAIYEYKIQRSRFMGGHQRRAGDYVKCWILLMGPLCEIFAVPTELVVRTLEMEKTHMTVVYGPDDRVAAINPPEGGGASKGLPEWAPRVIPRTPTEEDALTEGQAQGASAKSEAEKKTQKDDSAQQPSLVPPEVGSPECGGYRDRPSGGNPGSQYNPAAPRRC